MKKMVVKVVVLVLVLAAVGSIGFIFGKAQKAEAYTKEVEFKMGKEFSSNDPDNGFILLYELIDPETGVHYFVRYEDANGREDHDCIRFITPRYDKKGNVMVTKVK